MQGDTAAAQANGQAGARPCKMTVGDAGTEAEKLSQFVDIHRAYIRTEAPLSAQRSLFEGLLFRCPFGANKCKLIVYHRFAKIVRTLFGKNRNAFRRRSSGGKKVGRAYFQLPKRELPPF